MSNSQFYSSITQVLSSFKEIECQMETLRGTLSVQASHRAHAVQVKEALGHGKEAARLISAGREPCLTQAEPQLD